MKNNFDFTYIMLLISNISYQCNKGNKLTHITPDFMPSKQRINYDTKISPHFKSDIP